MCNNKNNGNIFGAKKSVVINIDNYYSLKETNDIYEETISRFNSFYDDAKSLKSSIEDYIIKLNKSIKQIFRQVNKEFRRQHYYISKTRYELKLELNRKIDDVKDELNNFLKRTENIISSFENISKAITDFGDPEESHIIRTWCYISEINKHNEKASDLFKDPKRTLLFSFNEDDLTINYTNYYFDGLPVPEDIYIEENGEKNIEISWKNDEEKIKDYSDRNKIEYEIQIKNNLKLSEFKSKEKKLILKNIDRQKQYKIRIRTVLNNSYSTWSKIKIFKAENLPKKANDKNSLFGNSCSLFGSCLLTEKNEEKKSNSLLFK